MPVCKDCMWWNRRRAIEIHGVLIADCLWEMSGTTPDSWTGLLSLSAMCEDEGTDCPCFIQILVDTPYEKAKERNLIRKDTLSGDSILLEPGVNFFVEALEGAGAVVRFTCEGHPNGFYIVFDAPYNLAFEVLRGGYFGIEMGKSPNRWILNMRNNEFGIRHEKGDFSYTDRDDILKKASDAWQKSGILNAVERRK